MTTGGSNEEHRLPGVNQSYSFDPYGSSKTKYVMNPNTSLMIESTILNSSRDLKTKRSQGAA